MHHQDGQITEQLQGIVPVADAVQAVGAGAVKAQEAGGLMAVNGIGGTCQRPAAQGADIHPLLAVRKARHIPPQLLPVGQQVLGKGDGLRPLQVGISGHHRILMLPGLIQDCLLEREDLLHNLPDLPAQVEPQVHSHLVIAAAGGMQALARLTDAPGQQRLHIHMDVLVGGGKLHLPRLHIRQDAL